MSQQDPKLGPRELPTHLDGAIAVVGMALHVPGADDLETFWRNLRDGVESIAHLDREEMRAAGVADALLDHRRYVGSGGFLDRMEWFDAGFFGLSPRDAAVMDPQTRHFLECCWHALEHAGHVPEYFEGSIGVFAGAGAGQYFWKNVVPNPELMASVGYFLLRHTGNDKDFLATRASYEFDLTGPSVSIQTACSTSLVAIHYACQSLLSWECDMALAGGVTIEQPHRHGYVFEEGEILSPDGHCRSYDHKAAGTVFGSGAGTVVLRRLVDAVESGDTVHAVIRASAVNNDGAGKVSYLAPSVDGQSKAVAEALSLADVHPRTIGLIEGHGTATPVGDPIEVAALTQAFRTGTDDVDFCALGSIKSNIGHLDTAAGVASLTKAVLALRHATIPPTVHFEAPNPLLELDGSPFYVNAEARPWPAGPEPRRAGVNSLGVGGTNAHVILEEAPDIGPSGPARPWHLLTLSTRSVASLEDAARGLLEHLESNPTSPLADVSFTLRRGRRAFRHRRALVCRSADEALEALATGKGSGLVSGQAASSPRGVAFLFAGGGAQYPGMARDLYQTEPVFRAEVDRCLAVLDSILDFDIRPLLLGQADADPTTAAAELRRPSRALPALFTVQYAQARLWMHWGVEPATMVGHSMGEYTAACLAGVFTLEDALSVVSLRGRLFETVPRGGMLGVGLAESELRARLGDDLSIAAINAPEATVAAGAVEALDRLEAELAADGIDTRRIRIDVAAHSHMLEGILEPFGRHLRTLSLGRPQQPFVSNLSGAPAGDDVVEPDYWVRHLRHTVRFAEGVATTLAEEGPVLLEVGPGSTLTTLSRMHPQWSAAQPTLRSLPGPRDEVDGQSVMLGALGALWTQGVEVDWSAYDADQRRHRVPAPLYPFERQPHFVPPPDAGDSSAAARSASSEASRIEALEDWVYQPTLTPLPPVRPRPEAPAAPTLVLAPIDGPASTLPRRLRESGADVTVVVPGPRFQARADRVELRPGVAEDWSRLWSYLVADGGPGLPATVVHAWALDVEGAPISPSDGIEAAFTSTWHLLRTLEEAASGHALHLVVLASGSILSGEGATTPEHALALGPARVAPREIPSMSTRVVDPGLIPASGPAARRVVDRLVAEIRADQDVRFVAYRGDERLTPGTAHVPLPDPGPVDGLADLDVVVITGGLGGIGLELARSLASRRRLRFVLTSRGGLPPKEEWHEHLEGSEEDDKVARAIRDVLDLEDRGCPVAVHAADVADEAAMRRVVSHTLDRFGRIDVALHAAGVLDDGPILARDAAQVARVLDPKVRGARVLDRVLDGLDLKLFAVFSSVSALLGAAGQIDYAAANAFLDAFARDRQRRTGQRTVSIGWGAWKQVGMAAELAEAAQYGPRAETTAPGHPIDLAPFDRHIPSGDGHRFRVTLEWGRHWMLDEHKTRDGERILPGSGYVSLIEATARHLDEPSPWQLENLAFLRACRVREDAPLDLEVRLQPAGSAWTVEVVGRARDEVGWTTYATARVVAADRDAPPHAARLTEAVARIGSPGSTPRPDHPVMDFGPRWANIVAASVGEGEALLAQQLPSAFDSDLDQTPLHAALLDMATAGAPDLVPDIDPASDFLIPAGYGRVRLFRPLPASLTSHVRLRETDGTLASFDVTLFDAAGAVLAEIEDFSMMRVPRTALDDEAAASSEPDWLRDAILPEEGAEMLRRVLAQPTAPHLWIVPRPLEALLAGVEQPSVRARPTAARSPSGPPRVLVPEAAAALEAHDAVAEAAVIGTDDVEATASRRVAFVVFHPGRQATVSELRRYLRKSMDRAAVPQNFVEMVNLPRDTEGAVAADQLRDPFAEADSFTPPRSETEIVVAAIWTELLGLDRVGIHDNFLDAGGHSLVGIRVLSRIARDTGVRVEANALTMQTLEQLAAEIDRARGAGAAT